MDSDSSRHKFIQEEIAKYGKGNITSRIFTYCELCEATKNFALQNLIGEGGFGRVYKGYIQDLHQVYIHLSFFFNNTRRKNGCSKGNSWVTKLLTV